MRQQLSGQRIALFESRLAKELSELVQRSGGVPVCVPAVRERRQPADGAVAFLLDEMKSESSPLFAFSSGVGASALFSEARALGRADELLDVLLRGCVACRGPKPVAALYKEGVVAVLKAQSPFTTAEFTEVLAGLELDDRMVVLIHYGEKNVALVDALLSRGARLRELLLYQWELPEDTAPLVCAIEELVEGGFAAAAFTSQIQARHLILVANEIGRREALVAALQSHVVVAAVGPTCARVLAELGIPPQVVPETPKMGPMLNALVARMVAERAQ